MSAQAEWLSCKHKSRPQPLLLLQLLLQHGIKRQLLLLLQHGIKRQRQRLPQRDIKRQLLLQCLPAQQVALDLKCPSDPLLWMCQTVLAMKSQLWVCV